MLRKKEKSGIVSLKQIFVFEIGKEGYEWYMMLL